MVNIVVRLPGDWPQDKLEPLVKAETAHASFASRAVTAPCTEQISSWDSNSA